MRELTQLELGMIMGGAINAKSVLGVCGACLGGAIGVSGVEFSFSWNLGGV